MTPELESTLKKWLEVEEDPRGFYDLLGLPVLATNLEEIAGRIDLAGEFFYRYQNNHKSKSVRERATKFGRQLAEARRVLRDPSQLERYERELVARLWGQFLEQFEPGRIGDVSRFCQADNASATAALPSSVKIPFSPAEAEQAQKAWAEFLQLSPVWENSLGMKMSVIPPGEFVMGSPPDEPGHYENEQQVPVTLSQPFSLGQCQVTQSQWRAVMESEPWKNREFVKEGPRYPATYVSWEDAAEFCRVLTEFNHRDETLPADWRYVLASEAQWEFACRAGTTTRYCFGDADAELARYAWYEDNAWDEGDGHPLPVGQQHANGFGLFDMHGNVWEWCRDWYHPVLAGGSDPEARDESCLRAVRGGSWGHPSGMCRSAYRQGKEPANVANTQGFRVATMKLA